MIVSWAQKIGPNTAVKGKSMVNYERPKNKSEAKLMNAAFE